MTDIIKIKHTKINCHEIDSVNCVTDRVASLIQTRKDADEYICWERSRLATESWRETAGEPLDIRRGKLFYNIMKGNPIVIRDNELVVGSQTQYVFGASPYIDYSPESTLENLSAIDGATGGSAVKSAIITDEARKNLAEDAEFWKGHSTGDLVRREENERFPWMKDFIESGFILAQQTGTPPAVRSVDYGKVINIGLEGIIAECKEALGKLEFGADAQEDCRRDSFLRGAIIACEGAILYAHRYSALAKEMAAKENDPVRKKELEEIAAVCEQVPAKPARSFREAVQSFWLIHLCTNLECASLGESPSRIDQYLYPMYKKDVIDEGTMSRQDAAELLACLFVKINEMTSVKISFDRKNIPGTHLQATTICGVDKNGLDASNELSYMLLEVLAQVDFPQPPLYVRYHNKINQDVWMKAIEVNVRRGDGMPAFQNDEPRILSFLEHGISLEDARDWAASGCAGSIIPHKSIHGGGLGINYMNSSKVLEYVLNDGREPKNGKQIGPKTGDPATFTCIEDYIEAFKTQFDFLITKITSLSRTICHFDVNSYHIPFASSLLDDCIKNGKDARAGGLRYTQFLYFVSDRGLQDVADSLSVINKLVLEEKRLSLKELLDAMAVNFEGKEEIRDLVRTSAPKYGNDDDYVDDIFSELSLWLQHRVHEEVDAFGNTLWCARSGAVAHIAFGEKTGALPNGRKANVPLADGFLSPAPGMDIEGPTAVFNSASKVNHNENSIGALMNMKFEKSLFDNKANYGKLSSLVENFFGRGGFHIQINVLDKETLIKAQQEPDEYKDLMVRVAGFSAFFVDLPTRLQDEIISRTEEDIIN